MREARQQEGRQASRESVIVRKYILGARKGRAFKVLLSAVPDEECTC